MWPHLHLQQQQAFDQLLQIMSASTRKHLKTQQQQQ
jgi:hypothetical protein